MQFFVGRPSGFEAVIKAAAHASLLIAPLLIARIAEPFGFRWFVAGAISWAVAVAIKIPLARGAHHICRRLLSPARSAAQGILSGTIELGCAALCFSWLFSKETKWDVLAFGAGASWLEICALLILRNFSE